MQEWSRGLGTCWRRSGLVQVEKPDYKHICVRTGRCYGYVDTSWHTQHHLCLHLGFRGLFKLKSQTVSLRCLFLSVSHVARFVAGERLARFRGHFSARDSAAAVVVHPGDVPARAGRPARLPAARPAGQEALPAATHRHGRVLTRDRRPRRGQHGRCQRR